MPPSNNSLVKKVLQLCRSLWHAAVVKIVVDDVLVDVVAVVMVVVV